EEDSRIRLRVVEDADGGTGEAGGTSGQHLRVDGGIAGGIEHVHGECHHNASRGPRPLTSAGTSAIRTASPATSAAPRKADSNALMKPAPAARRASKRAAVTCTPTALPSTRPRKARPPAAPCCDRGKAAIISVRLGTW